MSTFLVLVAPRDRLEFYSTLISGHEATQTMKTSYHSIALAGAITLALSACGDIGSKPATNVSTGPGVDIRNAGTGPGGGGGFGTGWSSGLSASTQVNDLSPTDVQSACNSFETYVLNTIGEEEITEFGCSVDGFLEGFRGETPAEAQAICTQTFDACIAEGGGAIDLGCPMEDALGCANVTVADVEACTNAQVALVQDNADAFDCSNATNDPQSLEALDFDVPECAPLDNCEFVEEDDTPPQPGG
jgi:hypothetical protein